MTIQRTRSGPVRALLRPFETFFAMEAAGGILLLLAAAAALVWANSPWAESYDALWDTYVTVGGGRLVLTETLLHWINDGLMAVFFFVVGLEIKREVTVGELSDPKRAALSVAAAIGGMMVPALIYVALAGPGEARAGWGSPMATDIAFALGVLALLGSRVPTSLKVFLTALAIIDDLGAVLVIALFYTAEIHLGALLVAAGTLAILVVMNRIGVRRVVPFALLGIVLWVAMLESGVHATIAGVLLAFTIPGRPIVDGPAFVKQARYYLDEFAEDPQEVSRDLTDDQRASIHSLEVLARETDSPLSRLEHALLPWVAFVIIPLFALANAGVTLGGDMALTHPVTLGVSVGLLLGKPIGVIGFSWLTMRLGLAELPAGVGWGDLTGAALLAGIGFTMSLFIGGLAFTTDAMLEAAKLGILLASLVAGVLGAFVLVRAGRARVVDR